LIFGLVSETSITPQAQSTLNNSIGLGIFQFPLFKMNVFSMEKIKIGWQPISYDVGQKLNAMHQ